MTSPSITARARCWPVAVTLCALALGVATSAAAQATDQGDTLVASRQAANRAWFGFSIVCSDCTMTSTSAGMRWRFSEPPGIVAVEPGSPAERAGLEVGDVLLGIDGIALASDRGAERFASARAGQIVRFDVRRSGRTLHIPVRTQRYVVSFPAMKLNAPTERPNMPSLKQNPPATAGLGGLPLAQRDTLATRHLAFTVSKVEPTAARSVLDTVREALTTSKEAQAPLRFSGSFGNSDITVRGSANTVVMIADRECWMEIHTADAVVRLQLREGCGKSPTGAP